MNEWINEFPAAITVCDPDGNILEMNQKSGKTFENSGGIDLIGQNMFDCHPENAREKLEKLLSVKEKNVYTIEKNGIKKLIYQSPWFIDGKFAGFVEISLEIPFDFPHFVR